MTNNNAKRPPVVIYVAGLPYSGTTLFASVLGRSKNIINGGEVNYVENDYHHEKVCSCGEKIDNCTFWKPVLEDLSRQAASGEKTLNFSPNQSLRAIDSRDRPVWKKILLVAGVPAEKIFGTSEIKDYVDRHTHLLRTLTKESGTDFIVDASKSFARLDVLRRHSDLPIHVIFLKRSILQSYASRLKRAKRRNRFYISLFSPIYLATIFANIIAVKRQLRKIPSENITFIEYEYFVGDPLSTQIKLGNVLQEDVDFEIKDNIVPIDHLHIYTGNVWLSQALQKGQTVKLKLGDGQSTLSSFEKLTFRLLSPISSFLDKEIS